MIILFITCWILDKDIKAFDNNGGEDNGGDDKNGGDKNSDENDAFIKFFLKPLGLDKYDFIKGLIKKVRYK